jgi:disulfide bond formation protein DsbB
MPAAMPTASYRPTVSYRGVGLAAVVAAGAALGIALASERWGGLVPCALCLLERWPYRVAVVLGLAVAFLPPTPARLALALLTLTALTGAAIAAVHVGVEFHWWPSPLPECAAPSFSGGSIAERLARMPAVPAKPCDDPTYFVPGLPLSIAAINLIFAVLFTAAAATGWSVLRKPRV